MADIEGASGNDTITGTSDADSIDGGNGHDSIKGGRGDDRISGGITQAPGTPPDGSRHVNVIKLKGSDDDSDASVGDVYSLDDQTYLTGSTWRPSVGSSVNLEDGTAVTLTDISRADTLITYDDGTTATERLFFAELSNGEVYLTTNSTRDDNFYVEGKEVVSLELLDNGSFNSSFGAWYWDNFTGFDKAIDGALSESGNDTLLGEAGNDRLYGNEGDDSLNGGADDDRLYGGDGDDVLLGRSGEDYLRGGEGDDTLTGGSDIDNFRIYETSGQGSGHDVVTDFGDGDTGNINNNDNSDNEFINLSGFYSQANYDKAVEDGVIDPDVIKNPLQWLKSDHADGTLNDTAAGWDSDSSLRLMNDGAAVNSDYLTFDTTNVVCFLRGTKIDTPMGEVPIEELRSGDLVKTLSSGDQPILWIGKRTIEKSDLQQNKELRPIKIRAGALGENVPRENLSVSPQHRILVRSIIAKRMFDTEEVLVPAKTLKRIEGVEIAKPTGSIEYYHILLKTHEILFANGGYAESLLPGAQAMKVLQPQTHKEIMAVFPEVFEIDWRKNSVRPLVEHLYAKRLVKRHNRNEKALYDPCFTDNDDDRPLII